KPGSHRARVQRRARGGPVSRRPFDGRGPRCAPIGRAAQQLLAVLSIPVHRDGLPGVFAVTRAGEVGVAGRKRRVERCLMLVSDAFARTQTGVHGEMGAAWLAKLPALLEACAQRWSL